MLIEKTYVPTQEIDMTTDHVMPAVSKTIVAVEVAEEVVLVVEVAEDDTRAVVVEDGNPRACSRCHNSIINEECPLEVAVVEMV